MLLNTRHLSVIKIYDYSSKSSRCLIITFLTPTMSRIETPMTAMEYEQQNKPIVARIAISTELKSLLANLRMAH